MFFVFLHFTYRRKTKNWVKNRRNDHEKWNHTISKYKIATRIIAMSVFKLLLIKNDFVLFVSCLMLIFFHTQFAFRLIICLLVVEKKRLRNKWHFVHFKSFCVSNKFYFSTTLTSNTWRLSTKFLKRLKFVLIKFQNRTQMIFNVNLIVKSRLSMIKRCVSLNNANNEWAKLFWIRDIVAFNVTFWIVISNLKTNFLINNFIMSIDHFKCL